MRIEKDKRKVGIICKDNFLVKGCIHINPGERIIDFLNNTKESFIAITSAEFCNLQEIKSFKFIGKMKKNTNLIILNKSSIKLIEEI